MKQCYHGSCIDANFMQQGPDFNIISSLVKGNSIFKNYGYLSISHLLSKEIRNEDVFLSHVVVLAKGNSNHRISWVMYILFFHEIEGKRLCVIWDISESYTGWPRKNRTGYFPQYVDAITGISVWGNFSWEKWYQDQQFLFSSLFSRAHFVRQCQGPQFSLFSFN